MRTNFPEENGPVQEICTEFAQNNARSADRRVRFPVTIRHRSSKAKIYGPAKNFAYYRLSYAVAVKRRMQTFPTYPEARAAAESVVRELANGSQALQFGGAVCRKRRTTLLANVWRTITL